MRPTDALDDGLTTSERREAAFRLISGLCNKTKRWEMTIPVNPLDSDILLTRALRDSEELEAQVAELVVALNHPSLGELLGEIEDSGTPEANRLWALANVWFDVRDNALERARCGKPKENQA